MVINHNMSSLYAQRMEGINTHNVQKSIEKLSSGQKINSAADNSANLAISEKMRSQIRGLNRASKNIEDGVSLIQTTEGFLSETTDVLQRIRELSVQAANGVYSDEDRGNIAVEVSQLVSEIDRISSSAQFNGLNLLTGAFAENGIRIHIGANMDQRAEIKIASATAEALGLRGGQDGAAAAVSIADADSANMTIGVIDEALKAVSSQRASLGAYQNTFEMAQKGVDIAAENLTSSESRIRDADYAEELVTYTRDMILQQASTAMIGQANSSSSSVLQLLRG